MTERGVVVFGASGFIGTRLIARLAAEGATPLRAVDIAAPRKELPGVEYIEADVRSQLPLGIGAGAHRIYNLAAVHRTPGHPPHEYYDTNVRGALNVAQLAELCDVLQILFTSSISVYGPTEAEVTESSPLLPVSDYGRSKAMAELIHNRWRMADERRRLVMVRPGVVFGPGERGNYTHLARALKNRMFAYPGRRDTIKSGGYVDELLDTFEFAMHQNDREILYNFAFPTLSTTQDIVSAFGWVRSRDYNPPLIPLAPLMAAASVFELAGKFGVKTPIHRERVLKLVNSTRILPKWLLSRGYEFKRTLRDSLESWSQETQGTFL